MCGSYIFTYISIEILIHNKHRCSFTIFIRILITILIVQSSSDMMMTSWRSQLRHCDQESTERCKAIPRIFSLTQQNVSPSIDSILNLFNIRILFSGHMIYFNNHNRPKFYWEFLNTYYIFNYNFTTNGIFKRWTYYGNAENTINK